LDVAYRIQYMPTAIEHLRALTAREQSMVVDAVDVQLALEPNRPTRNRKPMRPGGPAPWELRIGHLRVFYDVEPVSEAIKELWDGVVSVRAVGVKRGQRMWVGTLEWKS
jgi:mRNA-degrading endonuclease RelE of RelBE toxin-antitoxin system